VKNFEGGGVMRAYDGTCPVQKECFVVVCSDPEKIKAQRWTTMLRNRMLLAGYVCTDD